MKLLIKHKHNWVFIKDYSEYWTRNNIPDHIFRIYECPICKKVKKIKIF